MSATLWRAQAQLLYYLTNEDVEAVARVRIPAMESGHDEHLVPLGVVPYDTPIGGRFHLRCTLDHDDFAVAPLNVEDRRGS